MQKDCGWLRLCTETQPQPVTWNISFSRSIWQFQSTEPLWKIEHTHKLRYSWNPDLMRIADCPQASSTLLLPNYSLPTELVDKYTLKYPTTSRQFDFQCSFTAVEMKLHDGSSEQQLPVVMRSLRPKLCLLDSWILKLYQLTGSGLYHPCLAKQSVVHLLLLLFP